MSDKHYRLLQSVLIRVGALPFFLIIGILSFALLSDKFLTVPNLVNVGRQSVYLLLVAMGQMIVLVTGGFDLSVGTTIALSSVVSALVMASLHLVMPEQVWLIIMVGFLAALLVAFAVGLINGLGVAYLGVSPFVMTLGVSSVTTGIALLLTGGVPVSGLPYEFGDFFGFGRVFDIPVPVMVAAFFILVVWMLMSRTRAGSNLYAVGANIKAAHLSAINTSRTLIFAYVICAFLAAVAGLLLTARVESGEANLGGSMAMESIAACVIAGVSLRGGIGRVGSVVLGAFFIILMKNGMNLIQLSSYLQMVVLGVLLILAVVFDQLRYRWMLLH